MTESKPKQTPRFWNDFDPESPLAGADLADLRQGVGQAPGTVASMWRHHRAAVHDGTFEHGFEDWKLTAEHQALTLFGLHQQSQNRTMHRPGIGLGTALRRLREAPGTSEDALDLQMRALVSSDDTDELYEHLRALITRLRQIGQGADYSKLHTDLYYWNWPESRARVQRAWAAQYSSWARSSAPADDSNEHTPDREETS